MAILEKSSSRRQRGGDFLAVLLLAIILAALGWHWWHLKHPKKIARHKNVAGKITPENAWPKVVSQKAASTSEAKPAEIVSSQASINFPHPVRDIFEAQIALERHGISAGSIDGALGSQTRAALAAFQRAEKLAETRALDADTRARLILDLPVLTNYPVTTNDLARLQPLGKSWLEKSQQSALDYESILELVAEKAHAHPLLIRKLNPGMDWTNVAPGTVLKIPAADFPEPSDKAARVVIHLSEKFLEALDEQTNLLAHFPCSIAARFDKRPAGELHVIVIAPHPNYTFDPDLFPEAPEKEKLIIPPGPNNPVGVAWIGLDKTGYGIHGTLRPEEVGRTESHGCFRLANWNAEFLLKLVWIGMPVDVEP